MKIKIGEVAELSKTITAQDVRVFADLTGDHNPVHLDDHYASSTRFKRRVAHGMLTASLSRLYWRTVCPVKAQSISASL